MFWKKQVDSDKLPPTPAAVKEKVFIAHYITLQWRSVHISSASLSDSSDYGWLFNKDQVLESVMTSLAPAPNVLETVQILKKWTELLRDVWMQKPWEW